MLAGAAIGDGLAAVVASGRRSLMSHHFGLHEVAGFQGFLFLFIHWTHSEVPDVPAHSVVGHEINRDKFA